MLSSLDSFIQLCDCHSLENVFELHKVLVIKTDIVPMLSDELDAVTDENFCHLHKTVFLKCGVMKRFRIMGQHTLKNINNYLNTNIYSYLEISGGQSSN